MLDLCFAAPAHQPGRLPARSPVLAPCAGGGFEARAFSALWHHRHVLGIRELYRCNAARVDGFAITQGGETILLEMKETLGWGGTQAAGFQFLAGRKLLGLEASRGIIVFERESAEWHRSGPRGAWGQLALEATSVAAHVGIGALQVLRDGSVKIFGHDPIVS
jgi:hypothetical protein